MKKTLSIVTIGSILLLALLLPALSVQAEALPQFTPELKEGEELIQPAYEVPEYVQQLLSVAREELGYTEGKYGRTKYGEWVGDPTCQWCAEYLCWCVDQTDKRFSQELLYNVYPMYGASNVGRNWFIAQGRYIARTGHVPNWGSQWYKGESTMMKKNSYIPQPGDWVFFSILDSGDTTHVAMVEYCTRNAAGKVYVHVLEGNNPDRVQRNTYALDEQSIQGYGTVFDLADMTMRFGNKGEKVRRLQRDLVLLGYMSEKNTTGQFGQITQDAVMHFQRDHGIEQTGNAGPLTQRALEEAMKEYSAANPSVWAAEE